jgi:hypothetical protein
MVPAPVPLSSIIKGAVSGVLFADAPDATNQVKVGTLVKPVAVSSISMKVKGNGGFVAILKFK